MFSILKFNPSIALWPLLGVCLCTAQTISPYLIGGNLWNGDAPNAEANLVWPRMKSAGFKLIRIGGISYNDKTPPVAQYARWIDSIKASGAEPLVQVSSNEDVTVAAALVDSLNIKRKYGVKFWSIGNEPTCTGASDSATLAALSVIFKARASAMKKIDPSIRIFVGDECYWRDDYYNGLIGGAEDITGKDSAGNRYIDGVSFHSYPLPGNDKNAVYTRQSVLQAAIPSVRASMAKCKARAAAADAKNGRSGGAALACALTEFNVTYWNSSDNTPTGVGVRSFLNGQFFAEVFGSGMEYGFFTMDPWSMLESNGDGSGGDLGLFDGNGAVTSAATIVPRPSYYHAKMIAANMGGGFIASASDNALVKTYATRSGDQAAVLLLNENESAGFGFVLSLNSAAPSRAAALKVHMDAGFTGDYADTLPPQSTLLLRFHQSGQIMERDFYSVGMAQNHQTPTVNSFPVSIRDGEGGMRRGETSGEGDPRLDGMILIRRGELTGAFDQSCAYQIELMKSDGKKIAQVKGIGSDWRLPIARNWKGLYIVQAKAGSQSWRRKIVLPGR